MLRLMLFGGLRIALDDTPITDFVSTKIPALLVYLAVTGRPYARPVLANLLWGEVSEHRAASSLRTALYNLRQKLPSYLKTTRKTIAFEREQPYWLDVEVFTNQLRESLRKQQEGPLTAAQVASLKRAFELYRGEFLEQFYVRDAPEFEEWVLAQRESLRLLALQALHVLADYHTTHGEYAAAVEYITRLLQIEPWQEEAHRQLMRLLSLSGQRAAALAQYEACRRLLGEELGVEPEEETRQLYERIKAGEAAAEAVPPLLGQHNLLPQLTPFVGRQVELALLIDRLLDPSYRLLTLVGEGGVGKTRLALAAAEHVLDNFAHGVWYVPLAGLTGEDAPTGRQQTAVLHDLMATTIANVLDVPLSGSGELKSQLCDHLRNREMLLLLDNLEHLVAGADLVLEILQQAPGVTVLAVSRQRLSFQAEFVIRLWGLRLPVDPHDPKASGYGSVQLFAERAERTAPDYTLDAASLPHVVRVCQLVGGLPLGIELAAAWVGRLPSAEILLSIQQDLDFLSTTLRDLPERHRSMRAVFESSWRLLSEGERLALAQSSVFHGGFDSDAAQAVMTEANTHLAALVDKSLLRRAASGRYELHELLRQFAAERMADMDNSDAVHKRHSAYYLGFVAQREVSLCGLNHREASAEMRGEVDNIREAWRWAAARVNVEAVRRCLGGFTRFLRQASRFQEGEALLGLAVEYCHNYVETEKKMGRPASILLGPQILLGRLSVEHAHFLNDLAQYDQALAEAQSAIALAQASQEVSLEAAGYFVRGNALFGLGKDVDAYTQLKHALNLFRDIGDRRGECNVLSRLAGVAWNLGDRPGAQSYLEQSLRMCRETGDHWGESAALSWLGGIAYSRGDLEEAEDYWEQSLQLCHDLDDRFGESRALGGLGVIAYDLGEYSRARGHLERALHVCREIGDRHGEGIRLYDLGNVAYDLGNNAQAQAYYEQAWQLLHKIGDRRWEVRALVGLGLVFHRLAGYKVAQEYCRQALGMAREAGQSSEEAVALTCLGRVSRDLGRLSEAADLYQQALSLWRARDAINLTMEPLAGLASIALHRGDVAVAQAYAEQIIEHLGVEASSEGKSAHRLAGVFDAFQVYLAAYRVLWANQDPRAMAILTTAHTMLQEHAANIVDEETRRSFLENVAVHREIMSEFARQTRS